MGDSSFVGGILACSSDHSRKKVPELTHLLLDVGSPYQVGV